jgi:hypothetical protein
VEKYSFDDPLPDDLQEVEHQLDYYHGRRHEGLAGSIFRDHVNVKIAALEHRRRQLSGRAADGERMEVSVSLPQQRDIVKQIIDGFRSKPLIAVGIVIVAVIIVGAFTESLGKIADGVARAFAVARFRSRDCSLCHAGSSPSCL